MGKPLASPANIRVKLERLAKDKRSSLLRKFATYDCKKFYNIGPSMLAAAEVLASFLLHPEPWADWFWKMHVVW